MMIFHGYKTVAAAGTAEPLATESTPCAWITFFSRKVGATVNTGEVRIGGFAQSAPKTVPTAIPQGSGIPIQPGDASVVWPAGPPGGYDLARIYVDADTNGDGVQYCYGVL
jgi:hypothetical protein